MSQIEIIEHKNHKFMFLDDYLWMWDTPQEKELQEDLAKQAYGDVLIAGYGFGILSKYALDNKNIKTVNTVEKYQIVIDKMKEFGHIYGDITINDYYDLPEEKKYDCIIGDIWPDIDAKFLDDYIKFKNKSNQILKKGGKLLAWGGDYYEYLINSKK
ncbi:hypothetical protein HOD96_01615 [Candidatus Falkowbacteria bacterium]|jgi:hypothetical protein|nr:hypothetical protein [Candidatus Falkowbacteria bacterium]MBT4433316.1 hypothetical protein [Candidatus Falkowbacteria bacterium]